MECDVAVLGGGPGGYPAAIRAAQLGAKVVLVEQARVGGTCITVGCIPTKTWVQTAHALKDAQHTFSQLGVNVEGVSHDFGTTQKNKETIVNGLVNGITGVVKANGIEVLTGRGRFTDANTLAVDGGEDITFKHAIIATGSHPLRPPVDGIDGPLCVDSTRLLEVGEIPRRIVILGGGVIGVEFASILSHFGSEVTIVEMLDSLIPAEDADASRELHRAFKKRGITMHLGARATRIEHASAATLQFESSDGTAGQVEADLVLVATGRGPNTSEIGLEQAGVGFDPRKGIDADEAMRTNVPHIFAVGDIVGQPMLEHKAVHEAHVAAEVIAGEQKGDHELASAAFNARVIPSVAYTDPEVAWVGLTEDQAKAEGVKIEKGLFPWTASGRAIANGRDEGFTKLLFDAESHRIVGGGIVGTHAGDMIGEIALAIERGADAIDIGKTIHPHPTLGESIGLAAEAAHGSCTDLPPRK